MSPDREGGAQTWGCYVQASCSFATPKVTFFGISLLFFYSVQGPSGSTWVRGENRDKIQITHLSLTTQL